MSSPGLRTTRTWSVLRAAAFGAAAAVAAATLNAALVILLGTEVGLAFSAMGIAVGFAVTTGDARVSVWWARALGVLLALFALLLSSYLVLRLYDGQGFAPAPLSVGEAATALERSLDASLWQRLFWGLALVAAFCTAGSDATGDDEGSVQDVPTPAKPFEEGGPIVTAFGISMVIALFTTQLAAAGEVDVPPLPDLSTRPGQARTVYWDDLRAGTCVRTPSDDDWEQVVVVDCTVPHGYEVMASTTPDRPETWLGDDAMDAAMDTACEPEFEGYVGVTPARSQLDYYGLFTDRTGWDSGDHTLVCLLFDPERHDLTGSVRGSAR